VHNKDTEETGNLPLQVLACCVSVLALCKLPVMRMLIDVASLQRIKKGK
jgi:hypothetical protein